MPKSTMKLKIEKKIITKDLMNDLIKLSSIWQKEDISYGIVVNTKEDFVGKNIYTCFDDDKLVAYLLDHEYIDDKKRENSPIRNNSLILEIDELYVIKEYRNMSIGRSLFDMAIKDSKADYVRLSTSTKDYKKVFNFYIDELGMNFHSASLFMELNE